MEDTKFRIIDKFLGYNSASDRTKLPLGYLTRGSKNVYVNLKGNVATRPGLKLRGSIDATEAGVKASYDWNTNVGTTRLLRVNNNKLQVESDVVQSGIYVWYDLLETSSLAHPAATLTRFVFDTWWDDNEKTDRLVMVRGDDKILHWSGAMAVVSSATATTITKQGTTTWAEDGFATQISGEKKIIISGAEYTYTGGESTTTLTGVTPDPSAISASSVAIQSVMVGNNVPVDTFEADFCKTIQNQLWVGSYSSRIVYISVDITIGGTLGFLNFVNTGSLVLGDPDAVIMDSLGKGIGVKDGYVVLFAGNDEMYIITPNFSLPVSQAGATSLTTSGGTATRSIIQKIEKKQLAGLTSALGHEFIDNLGEYLVWLDQKNRLRALGSFANVDSIKPVTLSLPVQNELSEDDFTGGELKVIGDNDGDTVYITAPNNARVWMYQIRETINDDGQVVSQKLWQPPQILPVSRLSVTGGTLFFHSNTYPQLYQFWDTNQWLDDHPSGETMPYVPVARFSYENAGDQRQKIIAFDEVYFEGYTYQGTVIKANIYFNYQGASGTREVIISDNDHPARSFTGNNPSSLGDSSLGDNPLGDGILEESSDQELVPEFRRIINVPIPKNCFQYSIEVFSLDVDCRWELKCFGTNVRQASENANYLKT